MDLQRNLALSVASLLVQTLFGLLVLGAVFFRAVVTGNDQAFLLAIGACGAVILSHALAARHYAWEWGYSVTGRYTSPPVLSAAIFPLWMLSLVLAIAAALV